MKCRINTDRHPRLLTFDDAFSEHGLRTIKGGGYADLSIGLVEWLSDVTFRDNKLHHFSLCVDDAWKCISNLSPNMRFWLVGGDLSWRPNDRIARYKRPTRDPEIQRMLSGNPDDVIELLLEKQNGLKYSLAVRIQYEKIREMISFFYQSNFSFLVATNSSPDWYNVLGKGIPSKDCWSRCDEFAATIIRAGGFVIRRVGFFDDLEIGVQALAPSGLVQQVRANAEKSGHIRTAPSKTSM